MKFKCLAKDCEGSSKKKDLFGGICTACLSKSWDVETVRVGRYDVKVWEVIPGRMYTAVAGYFDSGSWWQFGLPRSHMDREEVLHSAVFHAEVKRKEDLRV